MRVRRASLVSLSRALMVARMSNATVVVVIPSHSGSSRSVVIPGAAVIAAAAVVVVYNWAGSGAGYLYGRFGNVASQRVRERE